MKLNNKYFLLRHGQTIYQKENRGVNYNADENPFIPLTEEGKQMVAESAQKVKEKNITLIFSSPYLRTKQTAEITAGIIGIEKIRYDERLVDINLGKLMGKSMEESWTFYLGGDKKFDNKPEDGESWGDILERTKSFLEDLEKKYKDKNILIVSHADPIWLMAGYLRGYKDENEFIKSREDREDSYPKLAQVIEV
jgi:broad specificity phosphatase PhoE